MTPADERLNRLRDELLAAQAARSPHFTPLCPCPHCGHRLNAATDAEGGVAPTAGALTLCIECERALVFTDTLMLRPATEDEHREAASLLDQARRVLRAAKRPRP
jgi:hypothetical protein